MKTPRGKKLYSVFEVYGIIVKAIRSVGDLKRGRDSGILDGKLQERIMLAVTGVNKCSMCSYAHTEMALKEGLGNEEIQNFLAGDFSGIPAEEAKAVLFAQHYADVRGKLKKGPWEALVGEYGLEKAKTILAAARIMMLGNCIGIVVGSVRERFKGKRGDSRSTLLYEIIFFVAFVPLFLIALAHSFLLELFKVPVVDIDAI